MEKTQSASHWKQVHRLGLQANSSVNSSMNSNHSSLSAGYSRFQFKKSSVEKDHHKKNNMFQFTARNRQNPHDISILAKKNDTISKQPRKYSSHQIPSMQDVFRRFSTVGLEKDSKKLIMSLLKQLQDVIDMFKNAVQYFKKQYKSIRWDWNEAIKNIKNKQIKIESEIMNDLQKKLSLKQKQLDRLGRQSSNWVRNDLEFTPQVRMQEKNGSVTQLKVQSKEQLRKQTSNSQMGSPLKHLNISKVDTYRNQDNVSKLSRNNTIQSLLGQQPQQRQRVQIINSSPNCDRIVQSLRDRLSVMRHLIGY